MTGAIGSVSSVGAGVSQGRTQGAAQATRLKEQEQSSAGARAAALQLIQSAIATPAGTSGYDLDVLA
ncbi:MAG: hypothetical protein L3K26_00710 [Candidatus Hydrogenedentes bacterium]|nr:hypothetical protein [Candidatus Hydrogenedentota bacterium]